MAVSHAPQQLKHQRPYGSIRRAQVVRNWNSFLGFQFVFTRRNTFSDRAASIDKVVFLFKYIIVKYFLLMAIIEKLFQVRINVLKDNRQSLVRMQDIN